jgi:transposase
MPPCSPGCAPSGSRCGAGRKGTGVYGAGLTRLLQAEHIDVIKIDRPDRKTRRLQGKSHPIGAIAAAKGLWPAATGSCPPRSAHS